MLLQAVYKRLPLCCVGFANGHYELHIHFQYPVLPCVLLDWFGVVSGVPEIQHWWCPPSLSHYCLEDEEWERDERVGRWPPWSRRWMLESDWILGVPPPFPIWVCIRYWNVQVSLLFVECDVCKRLGYLINSFFADRLTDRYPDRRHCFTPATHVLMGVTSGLTTFQELIIY